MHNEPRTTDEMPVVPDEQPDEPIVPATRNHVLAHWKAADPDAFRPSRIERDDDDLPLDLDDEAERLRF